MESDCESLRERIKDDFGVDLPISGQGGGNDSPFIVTANDHQQAVDIQAGLLHYLCKGLQVPWRLVSQEIVGTNPVRTSIRIEVIELTDTEIVTETRRYYFAWAGPAENSPVQILPLPTGPTDRRSGISLPYELTWLHFEQMTDHEADSPGLGASFAYSSTGMKGTIYIYDSRSAVDATDKRRISEEFKGAVSQALSAVSDTRLVGDGPIVHTSGGHTWLLALLGAPPHLTSAVILTAVNGHFVKGRFTWHSADRQTHEMGQSCIAALVEAVGKAG